MALKIVDILPVSVYQATPIYRISCEHFAAACRQLSITFFNAGSITPAIIHCAFLDDSQ